MKLFFLMVSKMATGVSIARAVAIQLVTDEHKQPSVTRFRSN